MKRLLLSSRHLIASVPTDFPPTAAKDSKESKESKKLAHTVASLKSTKEISHPPGFEQPLSMHTLVQLCIPTIAVLEYAYVCIVLE